MAKHLQKHQAAKIAVRKEEAQLVEIDTKKMTVHLQKISIQDIVLKMQNSVKDGLACYLLSYNIPAKQKIYFYQIADYLLDNVVANKAIVRPIRSTLLFLSTETLPQIQNKFSNHFPHITFVVARLNRTDFPKIKYGNASLQKALDIIIAKH